MSLRPRAALAVAGLALGAVLAGCTPHSLPPVTDRSSQAAGVAVDRSRYVVRKGDSLYAIAWRFELDYRDVAHANGIAAPYTIYPGDVLELRVVEGAWRRASAPAAAPKRPAPAAAKAAPPRPTPRAAPRAAPAREPARTRRAAPPGRQTASDDAWQLPVTAAPRRRFSSENRGYDYLLSAGAKVRSASGGVVMYSGPGLGGFRHLVIVKASNRYLAAYGLNVAPSVDEGEAVRAGQVLADIRQGGALERRFHFEVRRDGKPVDPRPLIGS